MLKPIVSMNQMAMNESIATTCCYVWNGTSLLGSASLPHGGQLVAQSKSTSYVQIKDTRYPLNNTWWGYTGGHVVESTAASCVITNSTDATDGVLGFHDHTGSNGFTTMKQAIADKRVKEGFCDHKNPETCPYFKVSTFNGFNHVGATSAHYTYTGGHSWLQDHTAVQYSS